MAKSDPARLAAALRENLKKRKEQARSHIAEPSHGTDEEGDAPPSKAGPVADDAAARDYEAG